MQFNSLIFVFLFMPITLGVFYALRKFAPIKIILSWLIVSSLAFYGWWNPAYLGLIIVSLCVNFSVGYFLQRKSKSKILFILGIIFNLSLLGYFKYFNFFAENVGLLMDSDFGFEKIALPLAISFFTFQQIAYLVDVYKEKCSEFSFIKYVLFVTFFPQLIAGPIVHHSEMMPQMDKIKSKPIFTNNLFLKGMLLFTIGLFKKVILADALAEFANPLFDTDLSLYTPTAWESWSATLAYSGQIYFDFSGYCDMAMGLALFFGVKLPLNFNSPYKSFNISEFWQKWHITLGRFLKDYLYIPMGGNRVIPIFQARNLIVVMLLGGLWHGASWTFVIWGLLHGVYLALHTIWGRVVKIQLPEFISILITFLLVSFAWIFFRSDTLNDAMIIVRSLINFDLSRAPEFYDALWIGNNIQLVGLKSVYEICWIALGLFIIFFFPNSIEISEKLNKKINGNVKKIIIGMLLSMISILMIINECKETNEFIYFNF